jgi:GDSL-like lipase/acylhydrolase family protein
MKRIVAALVGVFAYVGGACAVSGDACGVAQHLVHADAPVPHAAAAIKAGGLTVAVTGTTSSTLPGANGQSLSYPARLEAALRKKLPNVNVKVISLAKPRQTALEMAQGFSKLLREEKPALVVWQTGTADAMQGIAAEDFQATLEEAVDNLHAGGADVVFMNMQYSPRTEAVLATEPYAEALRWVGLDRSVNLFDRQAIMRQWSELGTFDLLAATKSLDTAAQVHDCIGRLLANLIVEATTVEPPAANNGSDKDEKTEEKKQ